MTKDMVWSICLPIALGICLAYGWGFINWQLPPTLPHWTPFARGMMAFICLFTALYTYAMRRLFK